MELGRELIDRTEQRNVRDAYGIALFALLVSTLMLIASGSPVVSVVALIAALLQVVALSVTLRVSGVDHRWSSIASVMLGVVFIGTVIGALMGGDTGQLLAQFAWLLLTVGTGVAILRRLATYTHVTLQMVLGLLCIYLIIGLSFGLIYLILETISPGAFGSTAIGASGSVYFSFITLATVGFGDITPVGDIARAFAVAEAILGQLYLVSVVSLAVSRLGVRRRVNESEGE